MAHFNFVISQNAKWGHADFYIDCHRMTVPENILLQKKHWMSRQERNRKRYPKNADSACFAANKYSQSVSVVGKNS